VAQIRNPGPPPIIPARWLGGGAVALVHLAFLLALLLTDKLTLHKPADVRPMTIYRIPDQQRAPSPVSIPFPKPAAPPAMTLIPPRFSVAPPSSAITVPPAEKTAPASIPRAGQPNYNDLFSGDKKAQLKQFFTDQAAEDRRENAKPDHPKSTCDMFRKPDDLGEVGPRSNTGVPQNFKPALTVGVGGSDPSAQACN
jgi:hypothetical protein